MENVCKNQKIEILSRKKVFIIIIKQVIKSISISKAIQAKQSKQSNPL
jgi:hypothetical protein